uniref:Uncharacterized protein n=1 Tax=Thermosporothrix sp. COM3 TaxID=2490863 RepID=A0A455SX14_9CHLR|nr:hypothetical protein KTC_64000 [Thermosporothrix sp. COM3]
MQYPFSHQLINGTAWFKAGIELKQGHRPEDFLLEQRLLHISFDQGILDLNKAFYIRSVIIYQLLMELKNIHG